MYAYVPGLVPYLHMDVPYPPQKLSYLIACLVLWPVSYKPH